MRHRLLFVVSLATMSWTLCFSGSASGLALKPLSLAQGCHLWRYFVHRIVTQQYNTWSRGSVTACRHRGWRRNGVPVDDRFRIGIRIRIGTGTGTEFILHTVDGLACPGEATVSHTSRTSYWRSQMGNCYVPGE